MRFFKSGSLLSGSAVYLISNICNAAIPFALLPILTRYLTQEEYGQVAMFQTLLGALGAFVGLNVAAAAGRKYYDEPSEQPTRELREYITTCLLILLVSALICALALGLANRQLSQWLRIPGDWVLLAVLVAGCTVAVQLRLGQWQVRKRAMTYGMLQMAQSGLNLVLTLFLVVWLVWGAEGRVQAQVIAAIVFAGIAIMCLWKDCFLAWPRNLYEHGRGALLFGVPLVPHMAGGFLILSVDRFIINEHFGLASAGVYMVAVQLSMSMNIVFDALNKAYVPWLFERLNRGQDREKRQIVRLTYAWYAVILVVVIFAFLVGPYMVALIAGEGYEEAGEIIGWMALGQGFTGMYFMVTNYIFYMKRTGSLSLVTLSSGMLNVILLVQLIPFMGLKGAAISFCLANASRFLLTWWLAHKQHPMPWFSCLSRS